MPALALALALTLGSCGADPEQTYLDEVGDLFRTQEIALDMGYTVCAFLDNPVDVHLALVASDFSATEATKIARSAEDHLCR